MTPYWRIKEGPGTGMKLDEVKFFRTCFHLRDELKMHELTVRDTINILGEFIHYKRCHYLLRKWSELGFYNYGVTLDLGWFYWDKLPPRYFGLTVDETNRI